MFTWLVWFTEIQKWLCNSKLIITISVLWFLNFDLMVLQVFALLPYSMKVMGSNPSLGSLGPEEDPGDPVETVS